MSMDIDDALDYRMLYGKAMAEVDRLRALLKMSSEAGFDVASDLEKRLRADMDERMKAMKAYVAIQEKDEAEIEQLRIELKASQTGVASLQRTVARLRRLLHIFVDGENPTLDDLVEARRALQYDALVGSGQIREGKKGNEPTAR